MFENTAICGTIQLGKRGENKARRIRFDDPSRWEETFGAGTYELIHQRSGDTAPYPVALQYEAGAVYWVVSASDTAIEGEGKCELRYIVNDTVVKSQTWKTVVSEGLGEASAETPEPYTDWVDEVLNADVSAKQAAMSADKAAKEANENATFVNDSINGINATFANALKGTASGVGAVRMDDVSPIPHSIDIKLKRVNLIDESNMAGARYDFPVEVGKTYTFSCKVRDDVEIPTDLVLSVWNYSVGMNHNIIFNGNIESTKVSFLVNSDDEWGIEAINTMGNDAGNITDYIENIQLEEGSTATAYAPYVKDLESVKFKTYGKNLINYNYGDWEKIGSGYWYKLPRFNYDVMLSVERENDIGTILVKRTTDNYATSDNYASYASNRPFTPIKLSDGDIYEYALYITQKTYEMEYVKRVQVEAGTVATAFEPYKEPVEGVAIIQPTTTLVADIPGVAIEVTYNRDINKAFAELQNALISLGGNI